MKRLVFFFSATGNSLYVVRELAGENGKVLSIPQLMKKKQFDFEADEIGFVFPLYMHIAPYLVQQFIDQAHLKADYFFTVITFGARDLSAVELWETVAEKAGYHFDYLNTIKMVDNWLHHFDMNEQKAIDKHIPEQLEAIKEAINERRKWWRPVSDEERATHAYAYHASGLDQYQGFRFHSEFHFVVTDACIRCGICTKVCPVQALSKPGEGEPKHVSMGGKSYDYCRIDMVRCLVAEYAMTKGLNGKADYTDKLDMSFEELAKVQASMPISEAGLQHTESWHCGKCQVYCPAGNWGERYKKRGLSRGVGAIKKVDPLGGGKE